MRYILALPALLVLGACGSECYENQNSLPLAKFRYVQDSVPVDCGMDSLKVYGLGTPNDSVLWDGGQTQQLYLPFRVDQDTTIYVFEHTRVSEARDTATFVYERAPQFVSAECGVSLVYRMKSITTTGPFIDSITCPNGEITNKNVSNLVIYLHHESEEEGGEEQ